MGFRTIDLDTEEGMKRYSKLKATNSVQKAFEDDKEPFIEKFAPRPEETVAQETKSTEDDIERKGVVTGVSNLRVRKKPEGEVIHLISEKTIVTIIGDEGDWFFIRTPGIDGYVMKKFIQEYTTGG